MKSLALLLLVCTYSQYTTGQVASLSENFDASCPSNTAFPATWFEYNNVEGTTPGGEWKCAPLNGCNNTPGVDCTNYYNGIFNVDTSFLISPQLNLGSYSGQHVYLHFDSKTYLLTKDGGLSILASNTGSTSSIPGPETFLTYLDLTAGMSPAFSNEDSAGWVTHEVDLTGLENAGNFFLAFRYNSTDASGSVWFLDNISTSTTSILNIPVITNNQLSLKILGAATSAEITAAYAVPEAGIYSLSIIDMQGREVYKENKTLKSSQSAYTINNLNLLPGMYLIKMGNGNSYGTAKVIIP